MESLGSAGNSETWAGAALLWTALARALLRQLLSRAIASRAKAITLHALLLFIELFTGFLFHRERYLRLSSSMSILFQRCCRRFYGREVWFVSIFWVLSQRHCGC